MAIARSRARRHPSAIPPRYRGFPPSAVARIAAHFDGALASGDVTMEWSEGIGGEVVSLMRRDGLTWLVLSEQDGQYSAIDGEGLVLACGEDLAGVLRWLPSQPPEGGCREAVGVDEAREPNPLVGWPS